MRPRFLVCDIDGTLLDESEPTPGLGVLQHRLQHAPRELRLIYATGRTFDSVRGLVRRGVLPPPHAVAAQVGTELWRPPWRRAHRGYARQIDRRWDAPLVRGVLRRLPGATLQPAAYQTRFKVSAFVRPADLAEVLSRLRKQLWPRGARARTIYSGGRYLDVLPVHAGKRAAVRYLELRQPRAPRVLACGDSGNDLDLLTDPAVAGVVVGNAEDGSLAHLGAAHRVYQAHRPFATGVLEGTRAFRFWRGSDAAQAA